MEKCVSRNLSSLARSDYEEYTEDNKEIPLESSLEQKSAIVKLIKTESSLPELTPVK